MNCSVQFDDSEGLMIDFKGDTYKSFIKWKSDGNGISVIKPSPPSYGQWFKNVKRYIFEKNHPSNEQKRSPNSQRLPFLKPPFGNNLMETMERNSTLAAHCVALFNEYGLSLLFDKSNYTLKILKELNRNQHNILNT